MRRLSEFADSVPATKKIYHVNPSWTEASAKVIAVSGNMVVLDQTIFYPEGGGQICDLGTINGIIVKRVLKTGGKPVKVMRDGLDPLWIPDGTVVVHELETEPTFRVGQTADIRIDGDHRMACSFNHTAAHFLYAAIRQFLQSRDAEEIFTKGCFIGPDGFRFDLGNAVSGGDLHQIDERVNDLLRCPKGIVMEPVDECDDVFLWRSGGLVIPCGGTHAPNTNHIGRLSLRRRSKGKTTTRIEGKISSLA